MMEEGLIEEALLMAQALTEAEKHRDPEAEDVGGARGGGRGRGWVEWAECGCYHCQSRGGVILSRLHSFCWTSCKDCMARYCTYMVNSYTLYTS